MVKLSAGSVQVRISKEGVIECETNCVGGSGNVFFKLLNISTYIPKRVSTPVFSPRKIHRSTPTKSTQHRDV